MNCVGWSFTPSLAIEWGNISRIHEFYSHPIFVHYYTPAHEVLAQAYLSGDSDTYYGMADGLEPLAEALALSDIWIWNDETYMVALESIHDTNPIVETSLKITSICRDSLELLAHHPDNLRLLPPVLRNLLSSWLESQEGVIYNKQIRFNYYLRLMNELVSRGLMFSSFFDPNRFFQHVLQWWYAIRGALNGKDWSEEQGPLSDEDWSEEKDGEKWKVKLIRMKRVLDFQKLVFLLSNFQRIMKDELSTLAASSILASVLNCNRNWNLQLQKTKKPEGVILAGARRNLFDFSRDEINNLDPRRRLTSEDLQNDLISPFIRLKCMSIQAFIDLIHRNHEPDFNTEWYDELAGMLVGHLANELGSLEVLNCGRGVSEIRKKYFFGTDYLGQPPEFMRESFALAEELISGFDTSALVPKVGEAIQFIQMGHPEPELPDILHSAQWAMNKIIELPDRQRHQLLSHLVW